jgi:type VI secretion system protein
MHYDLIEGLLSRPVFPEEPGEPAGPARSIRNNMKGLLNTRRGSLGHMPDYGIPDISVIHKEFPDSIEMLRRAIIDAIRRFEPRLTDVEVRLIKREDGVFMATYLVSARIAGGRTEEKIAFKAEINSDGKMEIL